MFILKWRAIFYDINFVENNYRAVNFYRFTITYSCDQQEEIWIRNGKVFRPFLLFCQVGLEFDLHYDFFFSSNSACHLSFYVRLGGKDRLNDQLKATHKDVRSNWRKKVRQSNGNHPKSLTNLKHHIIHDNWT